MAPGNVKNLTCLRDGRLEAQEGRQNILVVETPYRKKRSAARDLDCVACQRWSSVLKGRGEDGVGRSVLSGNSCCVTAEP